MVWISNAMDKMLLPDLMEKDLRPYVIRLEQSLDVSNPVEAPRLSFSHDARLR